MQPSVRAAPMDMSEGLLKMREARAKRPPVKQLRCWVRGSSWISSESVERVAVPGEENVGGVGGGNEGAEEKKASYLGGGLEPHLFVSGCGAAEQEMCFDKVFVAGVR